MNKSLVFIAFLGALTIVFGAFGAHALKEIVSVEELKNFETAVRYQMFHVIVLLIVNLYHGFNKKTKQKLSSLFIVGIVCFSGSIYAITFGIPAKNIWFITPLGGLFFILGWLNLGWCFLKLKE
jgi:uncharacterized membrane protein YgdD (TMEM256/DUF423 family)